MFEFNISQNYISQLKISQFPKIIITEIEKLCQETGETGEFGSQHVCPSTVGQLDGLLHIYLLVLWCGKFINF